MVKGRRISALLLILLFCFSLNCCTKPAYALVVEETPEQTELSAVQDWSSPNTITPEGNLTVIDDVQLFNSSEKEFLTVQTKSGNYFYLIIERDKDGKQNVHFLNQVDEADLLALMDEEAVSALKTCTCSEKCVAGAIDTSCPVCKNNMSECTGTAPETEEPAAPPTEEVEEPETGGSNLGMILVVVLIIGAGGAAYYYFKFVRGKKQKDEDLDFYDDEGYEEEPYINEDEQPEFEEDEETEADRD